MIRVLLADDHPIVRTGLRETLSDTDDITVAGEAASGHEVLAQIRANDYDVLVLDLSMPGRSGVELIKQVKGEKPRVRILVLSMHSEEQYAVRALKAGASGYLTKDTAGERLVAAIRKVAGGGAFVSPATAERLALGLGADVEAAPHTLLSDREYEVFRLIVTGQSVTEIAERLAVSVKTVSTHKTRIMQKMKLDNQTELIKYAIRHQLIDESGEEAC
jgi:two-component system invasion response regulator UvrY